MKVQYKVLIGIAAVVLILAQCLYSLGKSPAAAPASPESDPPAETTAPAPAPAPVSLPASADVTALIIASPDNDDPVRLSRADSGWRIESLYNAPASAAKIEHFLNLLLNGEKLPNPETDPETTGTGPGQGLLISLGTTETEPAPAMIIGLRPEGVFDAVYARRTDGGEAFLLAGDVRGDMGVWKNIPEAKPDSQVWLETRVLSFDPAEAKAISMIYPDHRIEFAKNEAGEWEPDGTVPGGRWSAQGLEEWIGALADFRITRAADPAERANSGLDAPSHSFRIDLADGGSKTVIASPNRAGDGMWIETSEYPGQLFILQAWRFQNYFQRMDTLFPHATPVYSPEDISFIDIRRGGESVKLTRRGGEWRAVATSYPLKADRIARLASFLAAWRPADYADAGARAPRPEFGGPLVEVTLANGQVHQYRLGGRHPVFPWRYVLVDGTLLLSAADADAATLFPEFDEIMDLGLVFDGLSAEQVTNLELATLDGFSLLTAGRTATGDWEVTTEYGQTVLTEGEQESLVRAPLSWKVSGFHRPDKADMQSGLLQMRLAGGGAERSIILLPPRGLDVPYLFDEGGSFLIDRTAFFTWMGALRGMNQRLLEEAAAKAAVEAEEALKILEQAEREALDQALEEERRAKAAAAMTPPDELQAQENEAEQSGLSETPASVEPERTESPAATVDAASPPSIQDEPSVPAAEADVNGSGPAASGDDSETVDGDAGEHPEGDGTEMPEVHDQLPSDTPAQ